jgi:hypothetical protein
MSDANATTAEHFPVLIGRAEAAVRTWARAAGFGVESGPAGLTLTRVGVDANDPGLRPRVSFTHAGVPRTKIEVTDLSPPAAPLDGSDGTAALAHARAVGAALTGMWAAVDAAW